MADTLAIRNTVQAAMACPECGQRFGTEATFCPFDGGKLESVSWDTARDSLLGKVIDGRYQVVGVLGEGGMGTVYQVRHTTLDRLFAMKVLRHDLARDADLAERFMREARATASVKHPNIVAINDFGRLEPGLLPEGEGEVPYFVMENLVGHTLAQSIKAGGAIPSALGIQVVRKIAGALGAAHAVKIVHRDLKPENVFLLGVSDTSGEVDVRVVDFGAALIIGASRVTKAGIVFGTPHYMSPEQASGQPVDHRADIYALGIIMYEIFTGRVPFVADTYMGVLTQHMFVNPMPPSQVSERAKELGALEGVILRALEKKPEQRYATMQDFVDDIDRVATFSADGSMHFEQQRRSDLEVSRPVFALANALELPTREEMSATAASRDAHRRRASARAWITYGGIALGVAAATIGVVRLVRPREASGAAPSPPAPLSAVVPAASGADRSLAGTAGTDASVMAVNGSDRSPPPPPVMSAAHPITSPSPPAPASPSSRAIKVPSSGAPPKRPSTAMPGDFVDPWAK
jgi:serine/threonine-protein kinase